MPDWTLIFACWKSGEANSNLEGQKEGEGSLDARRGFVWITIGYVSHCWGWNPPVDPNPPAPRSVASRSSTSKTSGVVMRSRMS